MHMRANKIIAILTGGVFVFILLVSNSVEFRSLVRDCLLDFDDEVSTFFVNVFGEAYVVSDPDATRLRYPFPMNYINDMYFQLLWDKSKQMNVIGKSGFGDIYVLVEFAPTYMSKLYSGKSAKKVCINGVGGHVIDLIQPSKFQVIYIPRYDIYLLGDNLNYVSVYNESACK